MSFPSLVIGDLVAPTPIVQGGMGVGVSGANLASAVAEEGGVGVIAAVGLGYPEPDFKTDYVAANTRALRREIRKARAMTKGVLGVNIMVALTNYAESIAAAVDEGVDIIFSGAGLPLTLPKFVKTDDGPGPKLVPIVSSARAAALLCKGWLQKFSRLPDAFVVEGPLAGGHLGFTEAQLEDPAYRLENLAPAVVDAVRPYEGKAGRAIPVIAAGGVYTGADIYRFMELGAAGAQLGTRFVATHECDADPAFKQAYVDAREEDLTIIKSPVGMPGRALRNSFVAAMEQGGKVPFSCPYHCIKTCDYESSPFCIALALINARLGNLAKGLAFAGQNVHRITKLLSVKELIETLRQEYDACVQASSAAVSPS